MRDLERTLSLSLGDSRVVVVEGMSEEEEMWGDGDNGAVLAFDTEDTVCVWLERERRVFLETIWVKVRGEWSVGGDGGFECWDR